MAPTLSKRKLKLKSPEFLAPKPFLENAQVENSGICGPKTFLKENSILKKQRF